MAHCGEEDSGLCGLTSAQIQLILPDSRQLKNRCDAAVKENRQALNARLDSFVVTSKKIAMEASKDSQPEGVRNVNPFEEWLWGPFRFVRRFSSDLKYV